MIIEAVAGIVQVAVEVLYLPYGIIKVKPFTAQGGVPGEERDTHVQIIGPECVFPGFGPHNGSIFQADRINAYEICHFPQIVQILFPAVILKHLA